MSRDRPCNFPMDDLFKHLALGSWMIPMDESEKVIIFLLPHQVLCIRTHYSQVAKIFKNPYSDVGQFLIFWM